MVLRDSGCWVNMFDVACIVLTLSFVLFKCTQMYDILFMHIMIYNVCFYHAVIIAPVTS